MIDAKTSTESAQRLSGRSRQVRELSEIRAMQVTIAGIALAEI
jgi:hypothetical protein